MARYYIIKRTETYEGKDMVTYRQESGFFEKSKETALRYSAYEDAEYAVEMEQDDPKYDKSFMGNCRFEIEELMEQVEEIKTTGEDKEQALMELADEMNEMIALGWEEEEAREDEDAFLRRLEDYAEGLTLEEIWQTWKNVWEIRKEA